MVPDDGVADVLRRIETSEEASRALVDAVLEAGGKDNVTVVLARNGIPEVLPPEAPEAGGAS